MGPTPSLTDSTCVQGIVISPAARCRAKHIEIHYHYVRDHVARNRFVLCCVNTFENAADDLTKPLPRAAHTKCVALMGLSVRDSTAFDGSAIIAELEYRAVRERGPLRARYFSLPLCLFPPASHSTHLSAARVFGCRANIFVLNFDVCIYFCCIIVVTLPTPPER